MGVISEESKVAEMVCHYVVQQSLSKFYQSFFWQERKM